MLLIYTHAFTYKLHLSNIGCNVSEVLISKTTQLLEGSWKPKIVLTRVSIPLSDQAYVNKDLEHYLQTTYGWNPSHGGRTARAIVGPCMYILVKNKKSMDQTDKANSSSIHVTSRGAQ